MKERIIEVVQYNPLWPLLFEEEVRSLSALPGFDSCTFHHIGSTSIEGLAAKPIIDILVEVGDLNKFDEYSELLSTKGYKAKGEFGILGRRYFQKGGDNRTHQIHVFEKGSHHITEHLAFRNYLRRPMAI
ncbi:GrpB family protein [Photorhabdus stackebrandtii]|uniref:GrpB family protein n=1 Tax=Photorhabdus stackebrandtii TaxID=1123042 RepID=UPI001A991175|nr:GrpB family protein [Photorhabdus stackebrandtii]